MLETWLGDVTTSQFLADYVGKRPLARPCTGASATRLVDWAVVGRILEGPRAPDVVVARDGRRHPGPEPRTLAEARALFAMGCTTVIRHCERHDPALRDAAREIARELPGNVAIQIHATPREHHGFGWHYDFEDVLIVQTAGQKEYFLRANTVNPRPTRSRMPRDMRFEDETSPLMACWLVPGDFLYIPAGFWHVARCHEDALSLSVGVER